MVADIFQCRQNLDVLHKALRDLLALGIVGKIAEAEDFSLAGQRELRIERSPVDLIAELHARQRNTVRVQAVEQPLKGGLGERGIGIRQRMPAPHGGEHIGLVRPRGGAGRAIRTNDQLDANALRGGAPGEIDTLVVVRDAAADNPHVRRLELAEQSVLIGHTGAHGIDHIHAHDHLLRPDPRGHKEAYRQEKHCNRRVPHPVLPDHVKARGDKAKGESAKG